MRGARRPVASGLRVATGVGALAGAITGAFACARPPRAPDAASPVAADTAGPTVVLLSFDGFAHAYLERGLPLPNLARIAARGVQARALVPSFPSLTFPNHYTIVSGRVPGHSGVVLNKMWDPALRAEYQSKDSLSPAQARWYRAEALWTTAERQGVRSATFFWPGSLAPAPDGTRPTITIAPYDDRLPNEARVDSVATWLRRPAATRPRFIAMYVSTIDQVGHRQGPTSSALDSAVVGADRLVGRLLDSLAASPVGARTNVVVLSDHGMLRVPEDPAIDVSRLADLSGVRMIDNGPFLALWFDGDSARRETTYAALQRGLAASGARARVWRREETPERWAIRGEPRAGDLVVLAEPGYYLTRQPVPAGTRLNPGEHGWDPAATRALDGIFFAAGPDVRAAGTLPAFANVHVYPFLARLLRVQPAPNDGDPRVLAPALR